MSKKYHDALVTAIRAAGNQKKLAEICGCSRANISQSFRAGRGLPARFCVNVEQALGISRHVLRPDVFGERKEG
jgi:DNA-binding transcriptional regulator YdaS (Cro superfamily)